MREWDARRVASAAGAQLLTPVGADEGHRRAPGPRGVSVDTRTLVEGELFVGLRGERADGGAYATRALAAGAWGVLVAPEHARAAVAAAAVQPLAGTQGDAAGERGSQREAPARGAVLVHADPLQALHALARAWRRELGARAAKVIAITGSTGKTSTKDILAAMLGASMRVAATPANLNTEIGLPLTLLGAAGDTQALVLEMAMRGPGQIAQLTAITEPDVGVIVNVGPAHLELLGSLEAIAQAKSELIAGLWPPASAVVPAGEPLLEPHLRAHEAKLAGRTITFGEGGEVSLLERRSDGTVLIGHAGERIELRPSFSQAHNLRNLLAAVAAARAIGHTPHGELRVRFSAMRGQREELRSGVLLIDDCYNANPMSMRAAIDELAATAGARRVAVLGDMLELGGQAGRLHREIGTHAGAAGVELLITVGALAAEMSATFPGESAAAADAREASELVAGLLREGDVVLVKGSRGVGLERVSERLRSGIRETAGAGRGRR